MIPLAMELFDCLFQAVGVCFFRERERAASFSSFNGNTILIHLGFLIMALTEVKQVTEIITILEMLFVIFANLKNFYIIWMK